MSDIAISGPVDRTGLIQRLKRIQAMAGAVFFVFVALHLSNIVLAPFGVEVFNGYQRLIRNFYQFPLVEVLVIVVPLLAHAVCGLWLAAVSPRTSMRSWRARLHTWAGVFLLLFVFGHILAVRGPSFFADVYPEFAGLSFSLWYFPAYFYPYYFLLAVAGFYHGSQGLMVALRRFGVVQQARVPVSVVATFSAWIVVCLFAFDGHLFAVPDPADNEFARLYSEVMGLNLASPWR